jgi:predicted GNAT family N-acyltransferase
MAAPAKKLTQSPFVYERGLPIGDVKNMEIYRIDGNSPKWMITAYNYVRTDAFCFGQNIPIEREFSGDGPEEDIRALIIVDGGKPIAGLRVTYPEDGLAKFGRVCVIRERQKSGVGRILMDEAEKWVLSEGDRRVVITSQDRAAGFYEKLGYRLVDGADPHMYDRRPSAPSAPPAVVGERPQGIGFSCVLVEKYLS